MEPPGTTHAQDGTTPGPVDELINSEHTSPSRLTLNCDLGEGLDHVDQAVMPFIDMASIACGGHAGDTASMARCVQLALTHTVMIGAHPAYPNRQNFGRISLKTMDLNILTDSLIQQLSTLKEICHAQNTAFEYIKPHGALYHDVAENPDILRALLSAIDTVAPQAALLLQYRVYRPTAINHLLTDRTVWSEAFADRAYQQDGTLLNRSDPRAVLATTEDILAQALELAQNSAVLTINGQRLVIAADSLCVHGDTPTAQAALKAIHGALKRSKMKTTPQEKQQE